MQPKRSALVIHEKTEKHKKRSARHPINTQPLDKVFPVLPKGPSSIVRELEIRLAVTITCHCSISTIDHLGEVLVSHGKDTIFSQLRLHRTKCSKIITRVVAPAMKTALKEDLRGQKFSILVDEATDLGSAKHLCIVIRYLDPKTWNLMTSFLDLVPMVHTTGQDIYDALSTSFLKFQLDLSDCIGLASDGVSCMTGERNSLWSRMREKNKDIIQVKCVCHSLSLAIEKSFDKLPSSLSYLLQEVPSWFAKSAIRRSEYKSLFDIMNPDDQRKGTPQPFQKLSQTRWLVRGKVLNKLLVNWHELVAYFTCVEQNCQSRHRYKVRQLKEMLMDPANFWYVHFALPVVNEFEHVNSFFQSNDADAALAMRQLTMHYQSLCHRAFDKNENKLSLEKMDFGARFTAEVTSYLVREKYSLGAQEKVREVQSRCAGMLLEAIEQLNSRLPATREMFGNLRLLSPNYVLSQSARGPFLQLPFQHLISDMEAVEAQYRQVLFVDWREEIFPEGIPDDAQSFWVGIANYTLSNGSQPYRELAKYALTCLVLPISNATTERIFSSVSCIKTKYRSCLSSEMLEAITRIRATLNFKGKCCRDFQVTEEMLQSFNTQQMYLSDSAQSEIAVCDFL